MTTYYQDESVTLHHGSCLDVLAVLPDASVDSVCTDPPYGLANTDPAHVAETITRWVNGERDYLPGGSGFMGKAWDAFVPPVAVWDECLRVLKPGGHVLAFAGSRTVDLMTLGLRLAGFDIRDSVAWLYGSGFPKSLDVSKAIDRSAGRLAVAPGQGEDRSTRDLNITAPATDDARTWQGWGTALKPAFEPVVVARKPLAGTVAANVLAHGTGALNIDGCRVGTTRGVPASHSNTPTTIGANGVKPGRGNRPESQLDPNVGRWPANVVLDESQAAALDEQSGELTSGKMPAGTQRANREGWAGPMPDATAADTIGDTGGASRFFYVAREDATTCANGSVESESIAPTRSTPTSGMPPGAAPDVDETCGPRFRYVAKADASERVRIDGVAHPTVKPLALMRWLVRLVTPPGGTVLEPFAGSGTTVEACILEGFQCIAIEREADYLPLIRQRINRRRDPVQAVKGAGIDGGLFDMLDGGAA